MNVVYSNEVRTPLKKGGMYVTTKDNKKGEVRYSEPLVEGKIKVYLENGSNRLCHPSSLTIIGYFD